MAFTPITFNPAGARVIDGPRAPIPSGAYKVRIDELSDYHKDGKTSARFAVSIVEGPQAGNSALIHIGADMGKDANRGNLKGACISIGIARAALEQGNVTVGESTFKGKTAYIAVTARETPDGYDDVRFVSPEKYEQMKSAAQLAQAQGGQLGAKAPGNSAGADLQAPQIPQPGAGADLLGGVTL